MTVETADVQPREQGLVTLRGGELPWRPVSPKLTQVRLITLAVSLLLPLAATIVLATLVTPWVWIGTSALLVAGAWSAWKAKWL